MKTAEIKEKDKIIQIITMFFPKAKIYLFGSYARGQQKLGSDLDIAIDLGTEVPLVQLSQIREMISILHTRQNIDVVDLHSVPKTMQEEIVRDRILWKQ